MEASERKEEIVSEIVSLIKTLKRPPTNGELSTHGLTRNTIRHYFGTVEAAIEIAMDECERHIFQLGEMDSKYQNELQKLVDNHLEKSGKFLLVNAGANCKVPKNILRTLDTLNEAGYFIILLPSSDPASRGGGNRNKNLYFDPQLKPYALNQGDLFIGKYIRVCSILTSMKQIQPLTGMKGSVSPTQLTVIGSPKQELQPIANLSDRPGQLMTTGAVTEADYSTSKFMSQRTAYLATIAHKLGGIALHVKPDGSYSPFNVLFNKKHGHCFINGKKFGKGKITSAKISGRVWPDLHLNSSLSHTKKLISDLYKSTPKILVCHDTLDNTVLNPHTEKYGHLVTKLHVEFGSFYEEVRNYISFLKELHDSPVSKIVFTKSNHEDFIEQFISKGKHAEVRDRDSYKLLHDIASVLSTSGDKYGRPTKTCVQIIVELLAPKLLESKKFRWLLGHESFKICGFEVGQHGHLGSQGKRNPSLKISYETLGPCIRGHLHFSSIHKHAYLVAAIYGGGKLRPAYALNGPDVWNISYVDIHESLIAQLIQVDVK